MKHLHNLATKTPVITAAIFALCLPVTLCAVRAGTLDTTFNPSGTPPGTVTTDVGTAFEIAEAVAVQADGKIVAVGYATVGTQKAALVRYTTDGALDPSFGTGGIVTTPIGTNPIAKDVALQPDGKILITGYTTIVGVYTIFVARYNTDGTLDNSFDTDGIQLTQIGGLALGDGIAVQPDGKIVVSGLGNSGEFAILRYNSDGTPDSSFGAGGITTTPIGSIAEGTSLVLQADGTIVVAGFAVSGGTQQFALARYNTNGTIDTSFGTGGFTLTPIGDLSIATSVDLQSDGKIVLGGYSTSASITSFALARYTTNGLLDTTFGASGIVTTTITNSSFAQGIVIQPDDKIIAAGQTAIAFISADFALARYLPNGALDATFGSGGIVTTSILSGDDAHAIALQPDGKIVVAGTSFNGSANLFTVARYNGDPTSLRCSLALINKYGPRL